MMHRKKTCGTDPNLQMSDAKQQQCGGPKMLNRIGKDADDSRMLVDLLCKRVIRPDFEKGRIARVDGVDDLIASVGDVTRRLIADSEWMEVCQRIHAWQDQIETCSGSYDRSLVFRIIQKVKKFPTVERVKILLGEEMAELYSDAMENIEKNPEVFSAFPDERVNGGWNKQTAERAVSLVIDVISPYGSDPEGLATSYARYTEEYQSQSRERMDTHNADKNVRRTAARRLGIWLPMPYDLKRWEEDPRTMDRAAEFQRLTMRVVDKMRIMRSVLQFIPRRRFSNHTVSDLDANISRMKNYIRDVKNRRLVKENSPRRRDDDFDTMEKKEEEEK